MAVARTAGSRHDHPDWGVHRRREHRIPTAAERAAAAGPAGRVGGVRLLAPAAAGAGTATGDRRGMPLQNRLDPFGAIIVSPARGTFMGNRGGVLHNERREIVRPYAGRRWIS